jgi:hypothetical protein
MWAPLVLVCGNLVCFVVGGPVIKTEEQCKRFIADVLVPYVTEQSPETVISDLRCIQWEERS